MANISKISFIIIFLFIFSTHALTLGKNPEKDFKQQRRQMVERQLRGRDIKDSNVLKAMSRVPRHLFVPSGMRHFSYEDSPLPIGYEQTISQPYIVALMSQLLSLKSGEKVLEIGTGSGYQAVVLAEMGAEVFTIEIVPELGIKTGTLLEKLGYNKIKSKIGDGYQGWSEHAPFDAIIVTCAPTNIPEPLKEQLAEGGRMVIPAGESDHQKLYLLSKKNGVIVQRSIIDVRFVPMVNPEGNQY